MLETVEDAGLWSGNIHSALKDRLSHRLTMLQGFSLDVEQYHSYKDIASSPWESCIKLCTQIEDSHNLGKPVEEAFSTNVQRKLATTVPPRPKVDMPFADAIGSLKRMCQEMVEIMKVLDYVSPGNIIVRNTVSRVWEILTIYRRFFSASIPERISLLPMSVSLYRLC